MDRLPSVTAKEAIKAFEKAGFEVVRTKGSHHQMTKPNHLYCLTVPYHGHKALKKGTLRSLIRAAGLTVEEFVALLKD